MNSETLNAVNTIALRVKTPSVKCSKKKSPNFSGGIGKRSKCWTNHLFTKNNEALGSQTLLLLNYFLSKKKKMVLFPIPSQSCYFVSLIASYGLLVTGLLVTSYGCYSPLPTLRPGQNNNKKPYYAVAFKLKDNCIN